MISQATLGMLGHPEYLDTHAYHVQAVTTHGPLRAHTYKEVFVCDVMQGAVEINERAC